MRNRLQHRFTSQYQGSLNFAGNNDRDTERAAHPQSGEPTHICLSGSAKRKEAVEHVGPVESRCLAPATHMQRRTSRPSPYPAATQPPQQHTPPPSARTTCKARTGPHDRSGQDGHGQQPQPSCPATQQAPADTQKGVCGLPVMNNWKTCGLLSFHRMRSPCQATFMRQTPRSHALPRS